MVLTKVKKKLSSVFSAQLEQYNIAMSARLEKKGIAPNIRNTEETIEKLLSGPISMSRLGDGEFVTIFGGRTNYQEYTPELAQKLQEVLHSNVENHIVGVSDVFTDLNERDEANKAYWKEHLKVYRHLYYKYMDMNKVYYNTSATRVYKLLADKSLAGPRFEQWRKLWDGRDVVFIEGAQTRMGVGNDLFSNAKSIRRILGPSENAFSCWREILEQAKQLEKDCLFILALGPAATVISYELAKLGYYALDLGHIDIEYEWYKREDSRTVVAGKYVNEVTGGNQVVDCNDEEYLSQIIFKIDG